MPRSYASAAGPVSRVIVPLRQAREAKLVAGIDVFGIASITQLVAFLQGGPMPLVDPIDVIGDRAGKHTRTAVWIWQAWVANRGPHKHRTRR